MLEHVGAGDQTWLLCKSNQCFHLLSYLSCSAPPPPPLVLFYPP